MKFRLFGLICIGIAALNLSGCEKVEAYKIEVQDAIEEKQKEEAKEIPVAKENEEFILDYFDGGKFSFTLDGVSLTDERNEFASYEAKDVVMVNFGFENYSVNKEIMITPGTDFKVFDQNKKELKPYPIVNPSKSSYPGGPGVRYSSSIALGSENPIEKAYVVVYNQEQPIAYTEVNLIEEGNK